MENKRPLVIDRFEYPGKEILSKLSENNYNITLMSRKKEIVILDFFENLRDIIKFL